MTSLLIRGTRAVRGFMKPCVGLVLLVAVAPLLVAASETADRIQPWQENPRYWAYQGEPVLLLSGSDEDNLFNNPELMRQNFSILAECGGNYIRSTLSCRDEGNVWPFKKTELGYDLREFNPEFWNRLETSVREGEKQGIIVQIEVWATFDYYRDYWLRNPFNPSLNINLTTENSKLVPEWNHHPASKRQPFFFSIPGKNNDQLLLKFQQAFVRKVLDVTLPYPNVLYCLDNETRAPQEWAHYWAGFIHGEAKRRGTTVQLTEMWDAWDLRNEEHKRTYTHPELFSFVDVSQNNWQVGQVHYDRLMWYRKMIVDQPGGIRPMNNVKVYQRQGGGKPNDPAIGIDRWWQNLFAGCASTRFHRPTGGIGLDEQARRVIKAARVFTNAMNVFHMEPSPELLGDREENEAYCLAGKKTSVYAVYFPKGGEITLNAGSRDGIYHARWFDPLTAKFHPPVESPGRAADSGFALRLKSPDASRTWLVLVE